MLKRAAGYTIIEALIFLVVSGVMLAAAIVLVQGWQSRVQFDQSMRDFNSKVQQYVQDVSSGFFPGSNQYSCSAATGHAVLTPGSSGLGTNQDCIFLGKAFGVNLNSGNLNVYTVLGDRVIPVGSANAGDIVTNFDDAAPAPAMDTSGNFVVVDQYPLLWGATVKSSNITYNDASGNPHTLPSTLVGFYNNLQSNSAAGSLYVLARGYGITNSVTGDDPEVKNYIEENPGFTNYTIQTWQICMASNSSSRTALLTVSAAGVGISTKLVFQGC